MTVRAFGVAATLLFALTLFAPTARAGEQLNAMKPVVKANNVFALELYSQLRSEKGNLFFSPFSISSALAMTYAGAKGETANEMAKTLHFENGAQKTGAGVAAINARVSEIEKNGNVRLLVGNSLWPQQGRRLLPNYVSSIVKDYGGSITPLDYLRHAGKAVSSINGWVETKTRGKIKNVITPPLPSDTSLVLVNAIYFKGKWAKQFDPKQTTAADFTREDRSKTKVKMMRRSGQFGYSETQEAKLLELPYLGEELSMLVILPKDQVALTALEKQLTLANLESWLQGMDKRSVDVELPKFRMTWGSLDLARPLQKSGMRKAFGRGADFSGITRDKSLSIGKVLHKAVVEVNEEGTEAAAATAVTMLNTGRPRIYTFKADHSFLFAIRENSTGCILFLGRIMDPNAT